MAYHYKINATTGVERCRALIARRPPSWSLAFYKLIGSFPTNLPSKKLGAQALTWRKTTPVGDKGLWFLEDRSVSEDAPHQDILHIVFVARSPTGPWNMGTVSVPHFGVGIGDVPGEWVNKRTFNNFSVNTPDIASVFELPLPCSKARDWQMGGVARHFMDGVL